MKYRFVIDLGSSRGIGIGSGPGTGTGTSAGMRASQPRAGSVMRPLGVPSPLLPQTGVDAPPGPAPVRQSQCVPSCSMMTSWQMAGAS